MTLKEAVEKVLEQEEPTAGITLSVPVEYTINIWFEDAAKNQDGIKKIITEAQYKGTPLVGTWSFQKHPPHGGQGEHHLELYNRNNKIFALNKSGTAHDKSHGIRIPNAVADALRKKFPDWTIPSNNLIEIASPDWSEVWAITKLLND